MSVMEGDHDCVDTAITAADFDEHDRDSATSGLCGTFALALADVLSERGIAYRFVLAVAGPITANVADLPWRHALVEVDGHLFDVEGEVLAEHVLENYCWKVRPDGRALVTLRDAEFRTVLESTPGTIDQSRRGEWATRIRSGRPVSPEPAS